MQDNKNSVLMCYPTYFDVIYTINPWMDDQQGNVNVELAKQQWHALLERISSVATVKLIENAPHIPDAVFTANAGFIHNNTAILSKFSKKEREPEEILFEQWFLSQGYDVIQPDYPYEGEGDHLVDNKQRHWIGTGFRTSKKAIRDIKHVVDCDIFPLELVDSRWYHLDTCFCPLPNGELMWYPSAFSLTSQKIVVDSFETRIDVTHQDALKFACNAVCIESNIFMPSNVDASKQLSNRGYSVEQFALDEFLKSGGAAKCLVLHCNR